MKVNDRAKQYIRTVEKRLELIELVSVWYEFYERRGGVHKHPLSYCVSAVLNSPEKAAKIRQLFETARIRRKVLESKKAHE